MYNQILAKLVAKHPGLSKVFLGLIAKKIATKVTEESGIDAALTELDNAPISITDLAADFQSEGDRRVSDAEKVWKKKNPPKPAEENTDSDADEKPKNDDTPAWAKNLMQEVQSLKAEKVQTTIRSKAEAALKEVPVSFWGKRAIPAKEDELEAFVTEVTADYSDFTKTLTEQGLSVLTVPKSGDAGGEGGKTKAVSPEVKAFAEKQAAQQAKQPVPVK